MVKDAYLTAGKSKHTATDIMAVILDQEEKQTSAPSTTTNTTHTPSQTGASASIASAGKLSVLVQLLLESLFKLLN